jgi:RNA polymerase sigma factor (sigma-70 family)
MHPRNQIDEMFSTFVEFNEKFFKCWAPDKQLHLSMSACLKSSPGTVENYWTNYWHHIWRNQAQVSTNHASNLQYSQPVFLARMHLIAYLQEPCYWAAKSSVRNFTDISYGLPDCFNIAIAKVDELLEKFQSSRGSSIKTYARTAFLSFIYAEIRQRQIVDVCNPFVFLRKIGKKLFIEALKNDGLSEEIVDQRYLALICFNKCYIPNQHTTLEQNFWEAVANLYNREKSTRFAICDWQTIKEWLNKCSQIVRDYKYPNKISLNTLKPGNDSGELVDDLPGDYFDESLLDKIIASDEAKKRETLQSEIGAVLVKTLLNLTKQEQEILQKYYKEKLTQKQIKERLEISQPTINRRLNGARQALLKSLVQWSQDVLNISITSNLVEDMGADLREWLEMYYCDPDSEY